MALYHAKNTIEQDNFDECFVEMDFVSRISIGYIKDKNTYYSVLSFNGKNEGVAIHYNTEEEAREQLRLMLEAKGFSQDQAKESSKNFNMSIDNFEDEEEKPKNFLERMHKKHIERNENENLND